MKSSVQYTIKTCPAGDNAALEMLLNSMCGDGWELYSIQEGEDEHDRIVLNCIFSREVSVAQMPDLTSIFGFKTRMERIMSAKSEPLDICKDVQKKIREERQKINEIKSRLDSTSEDERSDLNDEISVHLRELENLKIKLYECLSPEKMFEKIGEKRLKMALSEELAELVDPDTENNLITKIVQVRQNLTESLGYVIPDIKLENGDELKENELAIYIRGVLALSTFVYPGFIMFFKEDLNDAQLPENSIFGTDPVTGAGIVWIEEEKCADYWACGFDAFDYTARVLEHAAVTGVDDILDYSDVTGYIERVATENLFLVENVIPDFISVAELKYLLCSLIKEHISVKDIVFIFEKLNDLADTEMNDDVLTGLRRLSAKQITAGLADEHGIIHGVTLSDKTLKILEPDNETVLHIESDKARSMADKIVNVWKNHEKPVIVVTSPKFRLIAFLVLSMFIHDITVLSTEEIPQKYTFNSFATI